ncbi:hypothetical protein D5086_013308 [Populus alba]|uniref:Uncharacterized protein n=1 Tax=Populus alba TaxID=43335 RepID=A0ACC4C4W3_POPAL
MPSGGGLFSVFTLYAVDAILVSLGGTWALYEAHYTGISGPRMEIWMCDNGGNAIVAHLARVVGLIVVEDSSFVKTKG